MDQFSFEDKLLEQLLELQHGAINLSELTITANNVTWAKGYPNKKEAFWNCEAFMWQRKIDSNKRDLIKTELQKILGTKDINNLDIGSGSFCYLPSVAFDCSKKMLNFNDSAIKKVQGDLEQNWPFDDNSFSSITAIFVVNYIENLNNLLSEVKRILKKEGKFIVVISAKGVSELHQKQEKHNLTKCQWEQVFMKKFDFVDSFEKEDLWFFVCK